MLEKLRTTSPCETLERSMSAETLNIFPVIEDGGYYTEYKKPVLPNDVIVHYYESYRGVKEKVSKFCLRKVIGGHPFIFSLCQRVNKEVFEMQSEIEGYGFALVNLTPENREEVFVSRASFVESVTKYIPEHINHIEAFLAESGYSVEEIDDCIEKILRHPKCTTTREGLFDLAAEYQSQRIFAEYQRLFGESYYAQGKEPGRRTAARKRLFVAKFKEYLQNWDVIDMPYGLGGYELIRK